MYKASVTFPAIGVDPTEAQKQAILQAMHCLAACPNFAAAYNAALASASEEYLPLRRAEITIALAAIGLSADEEILEDIELTFDESN